MAKNSGNTKTTIELNGKLYDASTGRAVDASSAADLPVASSPGRNVDGFFRPNGASNSPSPITVSAPKPITVSPSARSAAPSIQKRQVEKSQTLMRSAVNAPQAEQADQPSTAQVSAASSSQTAQAATTESKELPKDTNLGNSKLQDRLERANQIQRSSSVQKFSFSNPSQQAPLDKRVEPLAVQPHPQLEPATPAPSPSQQVAAQAFASGLQTATSHQQPKASKSGAKAVKLSMASLAVVVLAGFAAYHNLPGLSLRLADAKAGISASLPNYTPAGFHVSRSIEAIPGQVTVGFQSNSDQRAYQVTQTQSDWTSSNLLESFVKPTYQSYQSLQSAGKTIYIDTHTSGGSSNATWVSNGLWYQIKSQANLSSQQLLDIINSL